ncbi:hypothetical protein BDF19DRAFT_441817 [Syncephalis fuscata]|nr:hypothetical protein BDF19DRAFT_441817 [Syncephalis fuscata]
MATTTTPKVSKRFTRALSNFERLLQCPICHCLLNKTHTAMECGHNFCAECAEEALGVHCKCPVCNLPARVGNLRKNLSHDVLVTCALKIRSLTKTEPTRPLSLSLQSTTASAAVTMHEQIPTTTAIEEHVALDKIVEGSSVGATKRAHTSADNTKSVDRVDKRRKSADLFHKNVQITDDLNDIKGKMRIETHIKNKCPSSKNNDKSIKETIEITDQAFTPMECTTTSEIMDKNSIQQVNESAKRNSAKNKLNKTPYTNVEETPRVSLRKRCMDNYYSPANYSGYDDTCLKLFGTKQRQSAPSTPCPTIQSPVMDAGNSTDTPMGWACSVCTFLNTSKRRQCRIIKILKENATAIELDDTHEKKNKRGRKPGVCKTPPSMTSIEKRSVRRIASEEPMAEPSPCILITGLKSNERDIMRSATVKQLSFRMVEEFNPHVTHVVVPADTKRIAPRTAKYMAGLLAGRWIVDIKWIVASAEAGHWIDPSKYEVVGDSAVGKCHAPRQSRLRESAQKPRLFTGAQFQLKTKPNPDIRELICMSGGKICTNSHDPQTIIVIDTQTTSNHSRRRSSTSQMNRTDKSISNTTITLDDLLRSISTQTPCWPTVK